MRLAPQPEQLRQQDRWDFTDLRTLIINRTLKRSPQVPHPAGLSATGTRGCRFDFPNPEHR